MYNRSGAIKGKPYIPRSIFLAHSNISDPMKKRKGAVQSDKADDLLRVYPAQHQ